MKIVVSILILIASIVIAKQLSAETQSCHFTSYKWNVYSRSAVEVERVSKLRSELSAKEIDPISGCTPCEEDQEIIRLSGINEFKACKKVSSTIKLVLGELIKQGQPIHHIVGYRVGMTRGKVDNKGNRTEFSNHSFGVAIDINTDQNGLYENCLNWNPNCRLIKGGAWNPESPGSWTADSLTVRLFKKNGFQWGGEIKGQQKDFMHFSPTGY